MRIDTADDETNDDDTAEDDTDFTNYYCPGKFDICCKDSDFKIATEEGSTKYNEPDVHEANSHLLLQDNLATADTKYEENLKVRRFLHIRNN